MTASIALFTRDLRIHDNPVLTAAHQAGNVHIAADVSGYSVCRADRLRARLSELDCALLIHGGSATAIAPGALRPSGGGDHFAVFTPYFRRRPEANQRTPFNAPEPVRAVDSWSGGCAETRPELATAFRHGSRDKFSRCVDTASFGA